jgi:CO dehydrogenase maturation factor
VLALDVDTMPGLSYALGMDAAEPRLPPGLASRVEGKGWVVRDGLRPARLVDRFSARGPDDVRLLVLGKLPHRVEPSVSTAFRHVMERFRRRRWDVVGDLAAGTRQAMFGWANFADTRVIVVEPTAKSLISGRRLARVATHVVASQVKGEDDAARVAAAVGLPLIGAIPYDDAVREADRLGVAPIDHSPGSPAVAAMLRLVDRLLEMQR